MKRVVAIIEKGEDGGYAIYARDISGVYGYGLTEDEAKADFLEVLSEQLEYIEEKTGKAQEYNTSDVDYRYDFSAFFQAFPFFNVSELAKELGINSSLFRKYKSGHAQASEKQKERIQSYFDNIVKKLHSVKF